MNTLTEIALLEITGGFDPSQYPNPTGLDEAQLQRLLDSQAAQQDLAYQAWIRSLLDSMAP